MKKYLCSTLTALLLCSNGALAYELVPTNDRLYEELNWLNNRNIIQINLSTWPLSADEIRYALDHAQTDTINDAEIINRIRQSLDNRNQRKFTLQTETQTERPLLPIGMEQPHDQHTVSGNANFSNERFDANLQVNAYGGDAGGRSKRDMFEGETVKRTQKADFAGSYGGIKIANQWLSVGQQDRFWGPGHEGSLILGDSARPLPAVNLQRNVQKPFENKYLSWLGKWNYQIFFGQMLNSDNMRSPRNTKLAGMRVTLSPTPYLDLGASRIIQWGGQGRIQNWKALGNAIIGRDNDGYTGKDSYREPGNQLAGVDIRLKLHPLLKVPVSVYAQMVGEDEANLFPSKNFFLAGIDGSHKISPNQTLNWHLEAADTSTKLGKMTGVTYGHHLYKDGYYQQGMPMGHALGGDVRSVVLGVNSTLYNPSRSRLLQSQHFGGKLMYAQTQRRNSANEKSYKGMEVFWQGIIPLRRQMDLQVGAKGWLVKPEQGQTQAGASIKTGLTF